MKDTFNQERSWTVYVGRTLQAAKGKKIVLAISRADAISRSGLRGAIHARPSKASDTY